MKRVLWILCALTLFASGAAFADATPGEATPGEARVEEAQGTLAAKVAVAAPLCLVQSEKGVFARLAVGDSLEVLQVGSCWCRVRADAGEGFVPTIYLSFDEGERGPRIAILNAAAGSTAVHPKASLGAQKALIKPGRVLAVLGEEEQFTHVAMPGLEGYVLTNRLTVKMAEDMEGGRMQVVDPDDPARETTVNLRWSPSLEAPIAARVPTGTEILLLFPDDEWSQVELDGVRGYMMTRYLTPVTAVDQTVYEVF